MLFRITNAQALAAFRILFFIVPMFEILQLARTPTLWWREIGTTWIGILSPGLICLMGLLINAALVAGYRYRIAAVLNFIFCSSFFGAFRDFEYHMDYVFIGISLFAIFMPLHACYSVDAKRNGWGPKTHIDERFSLILMSLGVGIIYFESVFYKLASPTWNNGLGYWMPATVPDAVILDNSWLLDSSFMSLSLGWLPVILEATLLFGIWIPRLKRLYLLGILLHLGILITFPIPLFAIGEAIFYVLLLPRPQTKEERRQKMEPSFRLSLKAVYIVLACIAPFQLISSSRAKLFKDNTPAKSFMADIQDWGHQNRHYLSQYLGIAHHPVFMDFHFKTRSSTIAIRQTLRDGTVKYLPGADETGLGDITASGRFWVYRKFRFIHLPLRSETFRVRLRDYLITFGIHGDDIEHYEVVQKNSEFKHRWESGVLTKRRASPYKVIARVELSPSRYALLFEPPAGDNPSHDGDKKVP